MVLAPTLAKYSVIFTSLCIFIISISFSGTLITTTSASVAPAPAGYTAPLFHRESIHSPYHDPNATAEDVFNRRLEASLSRYRYLNARVKGSYNTNEFVNLTTHNHGAYMASLWLGTPPQETFLFIDTGSTLTWTQCEPCKLCTKQTVPFFEPTRSTTYKDLPCTNDYCEALPRWSCEEAAQGYQRCQYLQAYGDETMSSGILSSDSLTFKYPGKADSTIHDVVFGCGTVNRKTFPEQLDSGVLGLGLSIYSFIYRFNHQRPKFSHCLGNASDLSTKGNLKFGRHTRLTGVASPIYLNKRGQYFVFLEGISVGTKRINFPKQVYGTTDGEETHGGVILDTGTEWTILHKEMFAHVFHELVALIEQFDLEPTVDPKGSKLICFEGVRGRETARFPNITIHLGSQADLVLDQWSVFMTRSPTVVCAAFYPAESEDAHSIIGSMAQQFYNIAYDIRKFKIWVEPSTCSNLR